MVFLCKRISKIVLTTYFEMIFQRKYFTAQNDSALLERGGGGKKKGQNLQKFMLLRQQTKLSKIDTCTAFLVLSLRPQPLSMKIK